MRNGNDNHQSIHDQKSIFLPMFCRLSIKDVKLNTVPISAAEPSSPRVSCMGQVKRNNRVIGYPAAATTTTIATINHHKHAKPRKVVFSTKTLLPNPTTMNATAAAKATVGGRRSGSRSCRTNREMCVNNSRRSRVKTNYDHNSDQDCVKVVVDISEMDPPLPVVKRVAPPGVGRDEVNLWKRRFNGVKNLQIAPIHLPKNNAQSLPTTV